MKLVLLVKWNRKVSVFFSVFIHDSLGAIPSKHHLFIGERWVHKKNSSLFVKRCVLSEYNSFDHFPKFFIVTDLTQLCRTLLACQLFGLDYQ